MSTATKSRKNGKAKRQPKQLPTVSLPEDEGIYLADDRDPAGKHILAAKLTEMVGFRLNLEFQPNCRYSNEEDHPNPPSQGHIWSAFIDENQDDEIEDFGDSFHVTIDDRLGDVRLQFIQELRRIGRVFEGMAQLVEREASPAEARYCKLGTYPTPPKAIPGWGVFLQSDDSGLPPVLIRQCGNQAEAIGYRSFWFCDGGEFLSADLVIRPTDGAGNILGNADAEAA